MKKKSIVYLLLIVMTGLCAYGCSGGGSGGGVTGNVTQINLAGSRQGQSVAFVDVDGDGMADKLVGAPYALVSGKKGAVLVYKGMPDGYDSKPTVMTGDDNFGFSVLNIGDVDGDGKDDFAVGAINGSGSGAGDASLTGTVSIYKGGSNGRLIKKLVGDSPSEKFGFSMAAADLNNDGFIDLIVGAPFNTNSPSLYQGGAVYVYLGPDFTRRMPLYASKTNGGLGWAVATGDINGDGIPDLLISASGKVLVFYGGKNFTPAIDSPDVVMSSSASGFGKAISVIGDLDGDGKKEIAVGAPNAVINGNRDTGSVYVVRGGTGSRSINLNSSSPDLLVRIDGYHLFDRFGLAIVSLGDLDNDGIADFAVGSPMADVSSGDLSGKVYFFKGKDISPSTTLANSTVFNGQVKNQAYGIALAGNKMGQLMIGGPGADACTGGVAMVDALTGNVVPGGSSGGGSGGGGDCH